MHLVVCVQRVRFLVFDAGFSEFDGDNLTVTNRSVINTLWRNSNPKFQFLGQLPGEMTNEKKGGN